MSISAKKTKRSLVLCSVAILLCVLLFCGSTLAWFSDSQALINTFTLGDFGIEVVRLNATGDGYVEALTAPFIRQGDSADNPPDDILFEPGATFMLPKLYVKNTGTTPLKYKVKITDSLDDNANLKLFDALDFIVRIGDEKIDDLAELSLPLAGGEMSEPITVYVHMKESAGNEYQGLVLNHVVIEFYAYQDDMSEDIARAWYDTGAVPD